MTPPRQHGSYGTRANPRGCLQTAIASIFAIVTVLQRTVAQSITIKSAACNFSPFAGNPMTELVAIRVAGSAYFMVGSQNGGTTSKILDVECTQQSDFVLVDTKGDVAVWPEGVAPNSNPQIVARQDGQIQVTNIQSNGVGGISSTPTNIPMTSSPVAAGGLQRRLINAGRTNFLLTCMFDTTLTLEKVDITTGGTTQYATSVSSSGLVSANLITDSTGSQFVLLAVSTSQKLITYTTSSMAAMTEYFVGTTSVPSNGMFLTSWPEFYFTAGASLHKLDLSILGGTLSLVPLFTSFIDIQYLTAVKAFPNYMLLTFLNSPILNILSVTDTVQLITLTDQPLTSFVAGVVGTGIDLSQATVTDNFFFITASNLDFSQGWQLNKLQLGASSNSVSCSQNLATEVNTWDPVNRVFTVKFNSVLQQVDIKTHIRMMTAVAYGSDCGKLDRFIDNSEFSDIVYTSDGRGITGRMKLPAKQSDVCIGFAPLDETRGIGFKAIDGTIFCGFALVRVGNYVPRPDPIPPLTTTQTAVSLSYRVATAATVLTAAALPITTTALTTAASTVSGSASSQTGIRKILKLIDSLNYLTALNGARLKTADTFLNSFKENPISTQINLFEIDETEIGCEPTPQMSREGNSCNALNNQGSNATSFLIYCAVWVVCAAAFWVIAQISNKQSLWYKVPFWLFFIPSKIITAEFLLEVFDGGQIESWRYALLHFNWYQPNAAQNKGLIFSIILFVLYFVYGVFIGIVCYHKRQMVEKSDKVEGVGWLMKAGEKLSWMDGLFDDFLGPDEIPHKVLYYMPLWQYLKVIATQSLLVFLSDVSMDQLKYIFFVEWVFMVQSLWAVHLKKKMAVWVYRMQNVGFVLILFFYLLHDYTAASSSPGRQIAYSVIVIVLTSLLLLLELTNMVSEQIETIKEAWKAMKGELAPGEGAKSEEVGPNSNTRKVQDTEHDPITDGTLMPPEQKPTLGGETKDFLENPQNQQQLQLGQVSKEAPTRP